MNDITLYCNCHGEKIAKHSQFNQKNLMCGAYELSAENKLNYYQGFFFDDAEDNISRLNKYFGELTGLYWIWKNTNEEVVGTNQYRIFWKEDQLKDVKFNDHTLAVTKQINVNDYVKGNPQSRLNVYDHYSYCHGDTSLILLQGMCSHNINSKLKPYMINDLRYSEKFSPYNMFIGNRKVFNKTCEILFEVLFEYSIRFSYLFKEIDNKHGDMRIIDYLSERILHMIYMNKNYFFGNIELIEIETTEHPHGS